MSLSLISSLYVCLRLLIKVTVIVFISRVWLLFYLCGKSKTIPFSNITAKKWHLFPSQMFYEKHFQKMSYFDIQVSLCVWDCLWWL